MLMWIMAGAMVFNVVYTGLGATDFIQHTIEAFKINPWLIIIGMQLSLFVLGCIMDPSGIMMITIPIYTPIIVALGFDPVWFGILFMMNLECGYLTPPFGWNLFYLKSIAPEGITLGDIYRSIIAFVALQIIGLILVMVFPQIALFLPNAVMGVE
jgi:TRAP-type mannitol/chloroaromatic compound transport system permease large subunit